MAPFPKVAAYPAGIQGYPFSSDRVNVKPLCLLLGLCQLGSAAALGLGEINVRSYLGQPLHATVALLDATPNTTADCFSLNTAGSIAPPHRPQLSIEQSGGQVLLHIRTPQPVNDPITQFVLVSDCDVRLQREYVVLLDPPALASLAVAQEAPPLTQTAPAPVAAPQSTAPRAPAARHPGKRIAPAAASSLTSTQRLTTRRTKHAPAAAAPRLVLSGKRTLPRTSDATLALRLDTNLPEPRPLPQEKLTPTELSDENTALSRKLAHLETQLMALQQRNAELDAALRAAPKTPAAPPPPKTSPQWPLYLLAIGLLAVGIVLIAWLLRRHRHAPQTLILDDSPWTQPDMQEKTLSKMTSRPQTERPAAPQRMPEIAPPSMIEGTEVKEDILDQAEVFMAHGHADLAIHLLQEHLREAPTESPVPWLLLLDLLHRAGDTVGYAAASAECRRYFNVNLTDHPISQDNDSGEGLEAYPHLLDQLVQVWNSPERDAYFQDLIYDHRGGTRMGFKPAAYRDILLLRAIAQDTPLAHAA
jgi:hypothetical protein